MSSKKELTKHWSQQPIASSVPLRGLHLWPAVAQLSVSRHSRMWGALQHPRHVEFYESFHAKRQTHDEDWLPMARAVQHLQSLAVAPRLYAFTSLWRFHLTTAPTYQECDRHCSVTVIWRWTDRRFHIAFGRLADGWVDDRPPEQVCEEPAFPVVVEPFIQRLLASSAEHETHDG